MTQKQRKAMSTLLVLENVCTQTHIHTHSTRLKRMCLSLFACLKTIRFNKKNESTNSVVSLCNRKIFN